MTKYTKLLLLLVLPVLFASCGNLKDISVSDYGDIKLKSLRGSKAIIETTAKVDNPTGRTLRLKDAQFDVFRKGYTFATISLPEKLSVAPHTNEVQTLRMELNIKNPLALLAGGLELESSDFTLTGFVKVSAGLFSKKMKFDNVTFDQMLQQLASY